MMLLAEEQVRGLCNEPMFVISSLSSSGSRKRGYKRLGGGVWGGAAVLGFWGIFWGSDSI